MNDKVKLFIENIGGNFQEVSDRKNIYQCMDLVYEWVFVLNFPKATIQHLRAYEVWTKATSLTKEYFDLLENTSSFVPVAGDLAVFKGGEAGHIGVVADNNNDINGFNIFEQNLPLSANPRVRRSSYNNILGFLRPKVQAVPQPEPIIEDDTVIPQIIDENGNAMQVHAIRSTINDTKRDLKVCQENKQKEIDVAVEKNTKALKEVYEESLKAAESTLNTEWKQKLADQKGECDTELTKQKLKYEKMVWQKVDKLPARILFGLWLKKLFPFGK